jgi:hypothetical protein
MRNIKSTGRRRFVAIIAGNRNYKSSKKKPPLLLVRVFDLETLEEFRDHVWVKPSKYLVDIMPDARSDEKVLIEFSAVPYSYTNSEGILKIGLININELEMLDDSFYVPYMDDYIEDRRNKRNRIEKDQHDSIQYVPQAIPRIVNRGTHSQSFAGL